MSTPAQRSEPAPPSFALNLAKTLPFMLVCGIVGPIFLVIYFLSGGSDLIGWMLWMGLGITLLDVGLAVGIAAGRTRSQARTYRLRQTGRRGVADILELQQTGVQINDEPLIGLKVRIHGADIAPFEDEKKCVVSFFRMPLLSAGQLPVLVDPETREWEFDWDSARPGVVPLGTGAAPALDTRPVDQRLAELDDLMQRDLLSREEYDAARARILGQI